MSDKLVFVLQLRIMVTITDIRQ